MLDELIGIILDGLTQIVSRKKVFDIDVLPMNLTDGRTIGELPQLCAFRAPSRTNHERAKDILFCLFHAEPDRFTTMDYRRWGNVLCKSYFRSDGSFTNGVINAVRTLREVILAEEKEEISLGLDLLVIRGSSLLSAHCGGAHTTHIYFDRAEDFYDNSSRPLTEDLSTIRFSRAEVHPQDLLLMTFNVPPNWRAEEIFAVASEEPMNVLRLLMQGSDGNIRAGVLRFKTGSGEILFRRPIPVTTIVDPEHAERMKDNVLRPLEVSSTAESKPLFRVRAIPTEFMAEEKPETPAEVSEVPADETAVEAAESSEVPAEATEAEEAVPAAEIPEAEVPTDVTEEAAPIEETKEATVEKPVKSKRIRVKPFRPNLKRDWKRLALVMFCGLMIPCLAAAAIFFIYSGRSKDKLHRQYLEQAVSIASEALQAERVSDKERLWISALDNTDIALRYGSSPAARELRTKALSAVDALTPGSLIRYRYGLNEPLPNGMNLTDFYAADQYTYALDSTSGSVVRFLPGASGMTRDASFVCGPGKYFTKDYIQKMREDGKDYRYSGDPNKQVSVGALKSFVLLPVDNPQNDLTAAVDAEGNVLYCSTFKGNSVSPLQQPPLSLSHTDLIYFANNMLYLLDRTTSTVWMYDYNRESGFDGEPSRYFGPYAPNLSDIIDFVIFREYSWFLRENGTLCYCDYTGYKPDCRNISEIENEDGSVHIDLARRDIRKLLINRTPDDSLYLMDARFRSLINVSVKMNYIRTYLPDRSTEAALPLTPVSAFTLTAQDKILLSYGSTLYLGNKP